MHHTQSPDTTLSDKVCSARPLAGSSSVAPVLEADISLLDSCNCSTNTNDFHGDSPFQSFDFTSHYLSNQQYSITAVTTSTGSVAERYAYTAYGQPTFLDASGTTLTTQTSTLNARYLYTGREWDATLGVYHFRARWMSGVAGRFLGRDPLRYISGWSMNASYLRLMKLDPLGMSVEDSKPPYPNATGPDKEGCYQMKLRDFIDHVTSGQEVPKMYIKIMETGCVGIVTCAQIGGTCTPPGPPEYSPATICAKAQKATDLIPDPILKAKCKDGEDPFIFAKQGVDGGTKSWPLGANDCYQAPKNDKGPTNESNPPVVAHDGAGGFNYIWYVNGWYIWVNHGLDTPGDAIVSFCKKPLNSSDYPLTMWCATCRKSCEKTTKYPILPTPHSHQKH